MFLAGNDLEVRAAKSKEGRVKKKVISKQGKRVSKDTCMVPCPYCSGACGKDPGHVLQHKCNKCGARWS